MLEPYTFNFEAHWSIKLSRSRLKAFDSKVSENLWFSAIYNRILWKNPTKNEIKRRYSTSKLSFQIERSNDHWIAQIKTFISEPERWNNRSPVILVLIALSRLRWEALHWKRSLRFDNINYSIKRGTRGSVYTAISSVCLYHNMADRHGEHYPLNSIQWILSTEQSSA